MNAEHYVGLVYTKFRSSVLRELYNDKLERFARTLERSSRRIACLTFQQNSEVVDWLQTLPLDNLTRATIVYFSEKELYRKRQLEDLVMNRNPELMDCFRVMVLVNAFPKGEAILVRNDWVDQLNDLLLL